jgi:7-carboxy-7-deazaguanine synthase
MRIAEIFRSIQGEGRLTGAESLFVRTSGCNLRCYYCDTPYASWTPEGQDLSVTEILARVKELQESPLPGFVKGASMLSPLAKGEGMKARHIVLTGGEPMLWAELIPLAESLHAEGWHITIETSGTRYLPVVCDLMSISPKLSNSTPSAEQDPHWAKHHAIARHVPEVIRRLTKEYEYQMKFVIDRIEDCHEVETYLLEFPELDRSRVMLMPQGEDAYALKQKAAWLVPFCTENGFEYCPRQQIEWFGTRRGT